MISLNFFAEIDIPTVNKMFKPKQVTTKLGKSYSTLYKEPSVADFQERLKWMFLLQKRGVSFPPAQQVSCIVCSYIFGFTPDRYGKRDVTNPIKIVEDAILGRKNALLPYDDSLVSLATERKVIAKKSFISVKVGVILIGDNIKDKEVATQYMQEDHGLTLL